MTFQIAAVSAVLVGCVILFVSGRFRVDVIALVVLAVLAITGLVTPREALSGFSSPAVVTVGGMFVLSGGLIRTGVASLLGQRLVRVAGGGELRLVLVVMFTAAILSAFMNNVAVAALLLPVVMDISRSTGISPSRLLMPLAYSTLLGGLTTLIGTPPNILAAEALREQGMRPFGVFDYTPLGGAVMIVGVGFMALVGRRLLPGRDPVHGSEVGARREAAGDLAELYGLRDDLFVVGIEAESPLAGRALAESRFGSALDLNVVAILREGRTDLAPAPSEVLRPGDRLLVLGNLERLSQLHGGRQLEIAEDSLAVERLTSADVQVVEVRLEQGCTLVGRSLSRVRFRDRFGLNVLAVMRGETTYRRGLAHLTLRADDLLFVQGRSEKLETLRDDPGFVVSAAERAELYQLEEGLLVVRVPPDSVLAGKTLEESRLGGAFGLSVLSIVREGTTHPMPEPGERLEVGDTLVVSGRAADLAVFDTLRELEVERAGPGGLEALRSERVGLVEAVLSPRSTLVGSSLRELHFREKYGLTALAIMREGEVIHAGISEVPLRFGDALLLHGPAERLRVLGSEPDFIVLTREAQEAPRSERAPLALLIMVATLLPVLLGWVPIYIAAVAGAAAMVLTNCLTTEEAYRDIEWGAVFLIAGMIPLGIALEQTGAAALVAGSVVDSVAGFGPIAVLGALLVLTAVGTQAIPSSALVVLMAPIVLGAASTSGISPYALMVAVAITASASFTSPIANPANLLVMGPGGYRFSDYVRVGLPLTLVVFLVLILLTPVLWPL